MLANGVLAGSEIALVALRKTRVRELAETGNRAARAAERLRDDPERFLATVQIGITVISATAGAFGGASFAEDLVPWVERVPALRDYAEPIALASVVGLVSYLSLVLGELVPKSLALRSAEGYALVVSRPLLGLSWLARPLVWFLTTSSNVVLRLFGDTTNFTESRLSREELSQLVNDATRSGEVHPDAGQIASRALDLSDLTAGDVMVPRSEVVAVPVDLPDPEVRRMVVEHGHSRMPVYSGTIDNIVGYVSVKDLLEVAWQHGKIVLPDIIRPAHFVPETKKAVDLLQEMRQRRVPFAIVVDEAGGIEGIVTLEDLVEELVGDIFSEHDPELPEAIRREPDGSVVISASVPVRDINRELDLALPEDGEWTTLAGLCLALAGKIPMVGEELVTDGGTVLQIVDASPRRVRTVRVKPVRVAEAATSAP